MANAPSPTFSANFRKGLVESFNIAELKLLCADLSIDFENIAGESKEAKAQELIDFLKHRGQLEELLQHCRAIRPGYPWPQPNDLPSSPPTGQKQKMMILFLASDPSDQARLRIAEEFRVITKKLQLAKGRDQFELALPQLSCRTEDISQALLDVVPGIVHFSGHAASAGLVFENQAGQTHLVKAEALANLFELFADKVSCVILNACFSEVQAKAIARHIDNVIGMSKEISDEAAIAFSVGFYQALGAGCTIEKAYKLGCAQIEMRGVAENLIPVLVKKGQVESSSGSPKQKMVQESPQTPSEVVVRLVFNKGGLVIEDDEELKASLEEALFAAENSLPVTFDVILEPLEVIKRSISSIESGEASPKNRIIKVDLQRQAKNLERLRKGLILALPLLLRMGSFKWTDYRIESLHGLARMSFGSQSYYSSSSIYLDIFRKDDPKLSAVIWIDETEQEQIKTSFGLSDVSDLPTAFLVGCKLFDLPEKTRLGKAIPAIILAIVFEVMSENQEINEALDLSKVLNLDSWSVGLH